MKWHIIPSLPSYEISDNREVRSVRAKKPVQQKKGIVKLYNRSRHTYTSRNIDSLYSEAMGKNGRASLSPSFPEQTADTLLGSILDRYRSIPVESLTHRECIDLLKVLMPSRKKVTKPVKEPRSSGYITPEENRAFFEKIKDRDFSGNTQEDVEWIFAEYAPKSALSLPENTIEEDGVE